MIARDESAFLESAKEGKRLAYSFFDPLVVHHYDADGISSGSIAIGALKSVGKKARSLCVKKLDDQVIDQILCEKEVIFVDLGSGNKRVNELRDVLVIDHHQIQGVEKFQVNPLLHGIDGSFEISAAGVAYCVFGQNVELAIVGAVGDMQHPLVGFNRKILSDGIAQSRIKIENDLRFYGRYSRALIQFLAFADDPILPGLAYSEEKAREFLLRQNIPFEKDGAPLSYGRLESNDKRRLVSAIESLLSPVQLRKKPLIGENYVFPNNPLNETYEANDFSTLLNACGRHGKGELGVRVCLKDESSYPLAHELLLYHKKTLREGIMYASTKVQDLGPFYFLDARGIVDEGIVGIVCGMVLRQDWTKPIFGLALAEDGSIKISGRSPRYLVDEGLNLGALLGETSRSVGGFGGGHKIAAGAGIPKDKINEFLVAVGEFLKRNPPGAQK
ncbi:DHH family phosphoesterase [Candidatus Micrarchaeota archaeon]|nr:DHH family phosphoesterase [Candidatus Micrarchaeota archaeon]